MFVFHDMKKGRQVAEEMEKCAVWKVVYSGSLIDLITLIKKGAED